MRMRANPSGVIIADPAPTSPPPYEADREASVVLPRPALRLVPCATAPADRQPQHGKHLLVVDIDAADRAMLSAFLRRRGYRVWEAANAAETQAMLTYKLPDLLLLDTHLAGVSGGEMVRQLRRRRRTTLLPIILISALAAPRDIRNGLAVGADDYIVKPLELSVVEARVNALLRRDARVRLELAPLAKVDVPALSMMSDLN